MKAVLNVPTEPIPLPGRGSRNLIHRLSTMDVPNRSQARSPDRLRDRRDRISLILSKGPDEMRAGDETNGTDRKRNGPTYGNRNTRDGRFESRIAGCTPQKVTFLRSQDRGDDPQPSGGRTSRGRFTGAPCLQGSAAALQNEHSAQPLIQSGTG